MYPPFLVNLRNNSTNLEQQREDIVSLLNGTLSKNKIVVLCEQAKQNNKIHTLLWDLAKDRNQPTAWRAVWALDHATQHSPEILFPKLQEIYDLLLVENHSGMKRQLFNLILRYPIKLNQAEQLLDLALEWLQNPKEATAVRANAVRFLFEIYSLEPDFKYELQEVLHRQLYNAASTGLINIIKKTITRLNKPLKKRIISSRKPD